MTDPTDDETDDGISRKWLVRILIAIAIAVPLLIEGMTFAGLIGSQVVGDGSPTPTMTGTDASAATSQTDPVGVGGELLPETAARDTVTEARLLATGFGWRFTFAVAVENTQNTSYGLHLLSVKTRDGTEYTNVSDLTVQAGQQRTVTGQWALPEGSKPAAVRVVATYRENETAPPSTVRRTVPIEDVPVQR